MTTATTTSTGSVMSTTSNVGTISTQVGNLNGPTDSSPPSLTSDGMSMSAISTMSGNSTASTAKTPELQGSPNSSGGMGNRLFETTIRALMAMGSVEVIWGMV